MIKKEILFILKRYLPHKQKICALTFAHGKINIVIPQKALCEKLWPGMMVAMPLQETPNNYTASQGDIIYSPLIESKEDLFWLHHLLELCYYFLPINDQTPEIYNHVCNYFSLLTYRKYFKNYDILIQKLCIAHFLSLTGLYENSQANRLNINKHHIDSLFQQLISTFAQKETNLDWLKLMTKNLSTVKKQDIAYIDKCIENGIRNHPCHKQFKTTLRPSHAQVALEDKQAQSEHSSG
ncbi:MAG: hypothetical protein ABH827_03420 [bacterium]